MQPVSRLQKQVFPFSEVLLSEVSFELRLDILNDNDGLKIRGQAEGRLQYQVLGLAWFHYRYESPLLDWQSALFVCTTSEVPARHILAHYSVYR